jgi:3-methyl-2-oxobutanoate hydroxymethyltransferase
MSTRPSRPAPATPAPGKLALPELAELKRHRRPIVMVTAHDFPSGQIASAAGVDLVLVGDSAAMTVLGYDSTVPATMDEMLMLTGAAARGSTHPLLVADMPFLSYQPGDRDAILNAGRFVKEAGADTVKMEGGGSTVDRIAAVVGAGIPVMGHLGLTPQSATALGGFKAQGRTAISALELVRSALAVEAAGAYAVVLECVPAPIAAAVTERLTIPTIGIGAGAGCDGQVLVFSDLLGLGAGKPPRFVEAYADLRGTAEDAVRRYAADVRARRFPDDRHTYAMPAEELAEFEAALEPVNPLFDAEASPG